MSYEIVLPKLTITNLCVHRTSGLHEPRRVSFRDVHPVQTVGTRVHRVPVFDGRPSHPHVPRGESLVRVVQASLHARRGRRAQVRRQHLRSVPTLGHTH